MTQLLVATRNRGKIKEIKALLDGLVEEIICAADLPDLPETVEDGATFAENALKKAREASKATGLAVLADDSGLVVDGLGGRPGVYSARFAGVGANDAANNVKLLQEVAGLSQVERRAAFVCSMAYVSPDGVEQLFEGRVGGTIIDQPRGDHGFGYDPLFLVNGYQQTMAELPLEVKNRISHRGQALRAFKNFLGGA
ncbi:XTP/dITP diphosphatase [Trichlorobacter lovleyi]|uniref:dITP/XTP pyrophosphatase n=1 Tax=Trichlorobacter lovleyi (strain ATCC BAA-1151 / DSM 17278 / SZ) TaxID=398767 RepID=B3E3D1_TRIL1|nr:XTP/dITP diphosphatase [Trichlorobacter lovleyi]ACD95750.1 non-canonical purine NTP pyrophosphatase, rdgB/HAM1 family [Trichlorobacter lovleyi SZ]